MMKLSLGEYVYKVKKLPTRISYKISGSDQKGLMRNKLEFLRMSVQI